MCCETGIAVLLLNESSHFLFHKVKEEKTQLLCSENEEEDDKADELLQEDFVCSCCFEILLQPTTLTCGHTFCRFCLANWWNTSKKAECLQCRRPFNEFPSVNFTLRLV